MWGCGGVGVWGRDGIWGHGDAAQSVAGCGIVGIWGRATASTGKWGRGDRCVPYQCHHMGTWGPGDTATFHVQCQGTGTGGCGDMGTRGHGDMPWSVLGHEDMGPHEVVALKSCRAQCEYMGTWGHHGDMGTSWGHSAHSTRTWGQGCDIHCWDMGYGVWGMGIWGQGRAILSAMTWGHGDTGTRHSHCWDVGTGVRHTQCQDMRTWGYGDVGIWGQICAILRAMT